MAREIELKLELTPAAADALIKSDQFPAAPSVLRQRTVYFDTPARDLSGAGFQIRIREAGGLRIQTVKATGTETAGLFARPEWEQPIEDDSPVIDDTTPLRALLGAKAHEIGPAFEVHVERRTWNVTQNGTVIELVLDRGEIVAGERRTPVCEIELELKSGSPSDLFAFARRIDAIVPLKLGVLNKSERGYRLLGPAIRTVKAEPIALSLDMTAAAAFRHIAGACLRQFRLNEVLLDFNNAEALHQARVALRRLRSAFTIHKPMLEDGRFDHLRQELRWLASALGEARDLDVLIARSNGEEVRAKLEAARADAYDQARMALASPRARSLMFDLSEWLALGEWLMLPSGEEVREQPARDFAAMALDRFRRRVKRSGGDLADIDDSARHELRKDAKKLRYATEFFAALFDRKRQKRRHKKFLSALEALQDHLGALNDLATAPELLARLGLDNDPAAAALLEPGKNRAELIEEAAEAHDMFVDAKRFWR
ncbi:CYTH and CHAD domain-containing protein [Chelativorans sp. YIM 93263]|uniref:CYTH and CHAD domain-containing protein n=1 Tax=Chelativorans sp. YIM 93263 TaxID=2906648 RepID=UPI002378B2A9|nr:CHAD domain-containing protein [Chelativorans sp. YIM 93263]